MTKQSKLRTNLIETNDNKSIPIGTVAAVRYFMEKLELDSLFPQFKGRGSELFALAAALISYRLTENFSIEGCGRWLQSKEVRNELGIRGNVSSRTLNRAVEIVGENMPEILHAVRERIFSMYALDDTDVNIDTTSISVYGSNGPLSAYGYSRDRRPDLEQVNFGVAELRHPINLPIDLAVDRGNAADPVQFLNIIENVVSHMRPGSMFVFDAGGDSKKNLDRIAEHGMRYVTRKKMNVSDDKRISELRWDEIDIVDEERGLCCVKHTFASSGRTTYLFFSRSLYETKMASVEGRARKCVRDAKDAVLYSKKGNMRISKTVVKKFNPLLKVSIFVQQAFFDGEDAMFEYAKEMIMNHREGFFKLESSMNLTPTEVYEIYRRKDTVEKLIESLKNHINIKPLRVWSEHSVKGVLLLGFLAQLIVSMMRFENPEIREKSSKFIIRSLEKMTVTHVFDTIGRSKRLFSNFEPLNTTILREIMIKPG